VLYLFTVRPVIAYTVPYIEIITGKNVSLSCVLIQGNPKPIVHWLHKGHVISDGNHYIKDGPGKVLIINIQKLSLNVFCYRPNITEKLLIGH
jgi:hypothetical protein